VYMDSKEMYNAGDDGKLLMIACPDKAKRFIYALDDDALKTYLGTYCYNIRDNISLILQLIPYN
jgi:hypothetical protein